MFAATVTDHWLGDLPVTGTAPGTCAVVLRDDLAADRSLQLLAVDGAGEVLRGTGEQLARVGLDAGTTRRPDDVRTRLARAGLALDDPDQLFYLEEVPVDTDRPGTRRLGDADGEAFAALVADTPQADVDEAYVELDHDVVVGTFDGDRLVCAASAYPWSGTPLGDIGVLTRPGARGRGFGTATVRSIAAAVHATGLAPQYRCDVTNTASAALAGAAGFRRFARWQVARPA